MIAVVQTMTCQDCRQIADVLIGQRGEDGPTGDPDYDRDMNLCPLCGGRHLRNWEASKPCPKCTGTMSGSEPVVLWD